MAHDRHVPGATIPCAARMTAGAVALGARVAGFQPRDNVQVLLDPAGHPFCLCRDDED